MPDLSRVRETGMARGDRRSRRRTCRSGAVRSPLHAIRFRSCGLMPGCVILSASSGQLAVVVDLPFCRRAGASRWRWVGDCPRRHDRQPPACDATGPSTKKPSSPGPGERLVVHLLKQPVHDCPSNARSADLHIRAHAQRSAVAQASPSPVHTARQGHDQGEEECP
jgi:hypothetical protein